MKAKIRKVSVKEIKTATGKSFKKVAIEASVVMNDKGDVRRLTAEMSPEYFRHYFHEVCGVEKPADLEGKPAEAVLAVRSYVGKDGADHDYTYIKFINLLDSAGNPIIPKKSESHTTVVEW